MTRWVASVEMDCIDPATGTEYSGEDQAEAARIGWAAIQNLKQPIVEVMRVDSGPGRDMTWVIDLETGETP